MNEGMDMYGGKLGEAVDVFFTWSIRIIYISVPLALWKIVDIGIWVFKHTAINFK